MISDYRSAVFDFLAAQADLADLTPHRYLPDDVNEVPALVVGRPSFFPTRDANVAAIDVPLYVVGRRLNDDGAQEELDAWADRVLVHAHRRIPGVQVATGVRATPETVQVAGQDFPAYLITLTTQQAAPCGA